MRYLSHPEHSPGADLQDEAYIIVDRHGGENRIVARWCYASAFPNSPRTKAWNETARLNKAYTQIIKEIYLNQLEDET